MNKEKRKKLEERGIVVTDSLDEFLNLPVLKNSPEEFLKLASLEEIEDMKKIVINGWLKNEIRKRKQDKEEKRFLNRSRVGNKISS